MTLELHFAEAVSCFSGLSQTGTHTIGKFCGHVAKIGQVIHKELSTNLLAAIPTIALFNFSCLGVLDLSARAYENWFKNKYKDPKLKVLSDVLVYGVIFSAVALFNIGVMSPLVHYMHPLVSIAIAVAAVALRALKSWYVDVYLPSKVVSTAAVTSTVAAVDGGGSGPVTVEKKTT